jgi:2'-5' RNA ligase
VRDRLAALANDVGAKAGGRAPPPENLHMTVAFVGDVPAPRLTTLREIGREVASTAPPFALALDRIGQFRAAGIAWVGTHAPPHALMLLAARLGDLLAADGFPVERRAYHPHVTLARRCGKRLGESGSTPIDWAVGQLSLNHSDVSSERPRYRVLARWPLLGCAGDAA